MAILPPRRRDDPVPPDDEPTDTELDAAIAAADAELLAHVRAHSDPTTALNALLSDASEDAADRPAADDTDDSSFRPTQAVDRILARDRARYLATHIAAADKIARDLDRHAGDNNRATASYFARGLARGLDRIVEQARAPVFFRILDRGDDRTRVIELFTVLDVARTLTLGRVRHEYLGLRRALDHAATLAHELVRDLMALPVDASGADLTNVNVSDLAALDGVVWDEDTRWPRYLRRKIVSRSQEIASGVYQVRGGTERDPSAVLGR